MNGGGDRLLGSEALPSGWIIGRTRRGGERGEGAY